MSGKGTGEGNVYELGEAATELCKGFRPADEDLTLPVGPALKLPYECDIDDHDPGCQCPGRVTEKLYTLAELTQELERQRAEHIREINEKSYETSGHPVVPGVTIKWRGLAAPYVEIKHDGKVMVAGWVHPSPDGPIKKVGTKSNPLLDKGDQS